MTPQPRKQKMPQEAGLDPSDSSIQHEIELAMLDRLSAQHSDWRRVSWEGVAIEFGLPRFWQKVKPDAVWKTVSDEVIVAECYSRIGELKPGHRRKLAMDALKLLSLRDAFPPGRNIRRLLVVPEELADRLTGEGWFSVAISHSAEVVPVSLLKSERKRLSAACLSQAEGQARTKTRRRKVWLGLKRSSMPSGRRPIRYQMRSSRKSSALQIVLKSVLKKPRLRNCPPLP